MLKLTIPLSIIAAAVLAACTHDRATPAPGAVIVTPPPAAAPSTTVITPAPTAVAPGTVAVAPTVVAPTAVALRPGNGRVESIAVVPGQASAGASQPNATRRLGIKMDDGTVQFVDTDAPSIAIGDRVELTADGYIKRPAS